MEKTQEEGRDSSLSVRYFQIAGQTLKITQSPGWKGTTGGIVWDCAILLAHLLMGEESGESTSGFLGSMKGKRIIDIGSGTGMLGIACALIGGAQVTLTDVPEQLDIIRRNVHDNMKELPSERQPLVRELYWGQPAAISDLISAENITGYDLVLCSDCVFCAHKNGSLDDLVTTLQLLCKPSSSSEGEGTKLLLAFQERLPRVESAFMERLREHFDIETVPASKLNLDAIRVASEDEFEGVANIFHEDPGVCCYLLRPSHNNNKNST